MSELKTVNGALSSKTAGFAFSATTVVTLIITLIASFIIQAAKIEENTVAYLYIGFLTSPIALISGIAITLSVKKQPFKSVFRFKCSPKYFLIAVMLVFGGLFALGWTNDLTVKFFELFGYEKNATLTFLDEYLGSCTTGELLAAVLVFAILPAIIEESLFRGVKHGHLEVGAGSIRAVFISGFCFSLFHTNPEQTVYQFILGCIFAFVAIRARSVLPGMLMHFINNFLVIILSHFNCYGADGALKISAGGSIALTVLAALCLIGGIVWLVFDKKPLKKVQAGGVKNFFAYASVAIVALAIIWLSSFIKV